ncbi:hypothetical protein LTS12_021771 [Elasticomyces elasticus]|nr:hypothetical protein LTS12_021771 [Elasticomyces elasticus]
MAIHQPPVCPFCFNAADHNATLESSAEIELETSLCRFSHSILQLMDESDNWTNRRASAKSSAQPVYWSTYQEFTPSKFCRVGASNYGLSDVHTPGYSCPTAPANSPHRKQYYRCGDLQHLARNCTIGYDVTGLDSNPGANTQDKCYKCGQPNHIARHCTQYVNGTRVTGVVKRTTSPAFASLGKRSLIEPPTQIQTETTGATDVVNRITSLMTAPKPVAVPMQRGLPKHVDGTSVSGVVNRVTLLGNAQIMAAPDKPDDLIPTVMPYTIAHLGNPNRRTAKTGRPPVQSYSRTKSTPNPHFLQTSHPQSHS